MPDAGVVLPDGAAVLLDCPGITGGGVAEGGVATEGGGAKKPNSSFYD